MQMRYEDREAFKLTDAAQIEHIIESDSTLPPMMGKLDKGFDEGDEERVKRFQRNIDRFYSMSPTFKYNVLMSFPRSGRDWTRLMFQRLTKSFTDDVRNVNYSNYQDFGLFATHSDRVEDLEFLPRDAEAGNANIIILVRDPRDACLSRMLFEHKALVQSEGAIDDKTVEHYVASSIHEWERIFEYYLKYAKCVIRYEDLCIYPVRTFMKLFIATGYEVEAGELADTVFSADIVKTVEVTEEDGVKDYKEITVPARYLDAFDRYNHCCNKWRSSQFLTIKHCERIFAELKTRMEMFGYTQYGNLTPVAYP